MNPIQNSITNPTSGSARKVELGTKHGRGAAKSPGASTVGVPAGGDMVSISNSARLLNTASSAPVASVSVQRISELKAAVASGQYTANTQKIAQGLLRDSLALQKATRQ
ncbi:MAG: flagellar biosynthesis anti-sigma factor FlgM [Burkholderiales bacterium]|nr:flagellar biosynthesis anti-sigma factor FlgM [Burkholderiales bacterium]